jgi:hypothetical protein
MRCIHKIEIKIHSGPPTALTFNILWPLVTIFATMFNTKNYKLCSQHVRVRLLEILQETEIIFLYGWLVVFIKEQYLYCAVRMESLSITQCIIIL